MRTSGNERVALISNTIKQSKFIKINNSRPYCDAILNT